MITILLPYVPLVTLVTVFGLWGHIVLVNFKVGIMWKDFCLRKGINSNAKSLDDAA